MFKKLSKGKLYCLICVAIIFGSYIIQRTLHVCFDITRNFALIEAIVFSAATLIVFFILSKSKETFYGILTAIFGFRMMPPDIKVLEQLCPEANIIYFLVQKFSILIFALTILKLYQEQEKPREIKAFPVLCTMLVVPFFTNIQVQMASYLNVATNGNMLYTYFSHFILYSIAMFVLLFVAVKSNRLSSRVIIDYQLVALLLNIGRHLCVIIILLVQGNHVSKSHYCWIAICAFFMIAFYILRRKKLKITN